MSTQSKFFIGAGGFAVVVSVVYWYLGYESAGFLMLLFMGLATAYIGAFILYRAGRERRGYAEDDPNADPAQQAGEHGGWVSAGGTWPPAMAVGLCVRRQGFVYGEWLFVFCMG